MAEIMEEHCPTVARTMQEVLQLQVGANKMKPRYRSNPVDKGHLS
jgi:hypothetical protein